MRFNSIGKWIFLHRILYGSPKIITEHLKEGEKQKAIEIANSLIDVLDIKTLSKKTGLSAEEIENLKNSILDFVAV